MLIKSKLEEVGESIFSVMSRMSNDYEAINLSQGFPNFDIDPLLIELVQEQMLAGKNQYAPMSGVPDLLEVLADKIRNRFNRRLNARKEITITAGATQAIYTVISAMIHPGDEVVLIEPAYDCYAPAVQVNGGKVVSFRLTKPDFKIYWSELRDLINEKTKMIILNTPHNPSGQLLDWEDWYQMERLMEDYANLYLLSDEVYEHIIFDGYAHESCLSMDRLWGRCFAVYSFGKTFHATGWKMGYVVAEEALMNEFRKVHQFNVFSVNTPIQYALVEYMETSNVLEEIAPFYQKKRDLLRQILDHTPLKILPCKGTYFQLVDFSPYSDRSDCSFAEWLTKEIGVAVIPPSAFYSDGLDEGLVRICFAKTDELILQAGERLKALSD